jgi:Flp pilus assembly pilin Flp
VNEGASRTSGAGRLLARLVREESGQSMTEYILILAMVLMIFSKLKGVFLGKIMNMVNNVGKDMDAASSDSGS